MRKLAAAVLLAQKINEESWDKNRHFYNKDLRQSAEEACKQVDLPATAVEPVYLLILTAWNDIQCWAEATIKG